MGCCVRNCVLDYTASMIEVEKLSKDYGTVLAVSELSFSTKIGEIIGFLGPNGAGKTTSLRMLAGALPPTRGRVSIAGHDLEHEPIEARRALGYMPEAAPLYPELRVLEYLSFRAALKGLARKARAAAVDRALQRAGVADMAMVPIGHLSKGYRQRVALADALVADPPLLILDEPTAGLDPNQIRETRQLIKELRQAHTVVVSSHILSEIEELCDRALVIHHGRIVAQGTIDELRALVDVSTVTVRVRKQPGKGQAIGAEAICHEIPGVAQVTSRHDGPTTNVTTLNVQCAGGIDLDLVCEELIARLQQAGHVVLTVTPHRARLEDIFAEVTRSAPESPVRSRT
jgi:ABC-2 type transport system ATP-binding protein